MDVFNQYHFVINHLRDVIADRLDVNHNHIRTISITEIKTYSYGSDTTVECTVVFMKDQDQHTAIWKICKTDDKTFEACSIQD